MNQAYTLTGISMEPCAHDISGIWYMDIIAYTILIHYT